MDLDNERHSRNRLAVAADLSDAALLRRVAALAGSEREATVELVAHLAELDSRRLYLSEGFGSLFSYCTGALRLAEHAAYNRIEAARASRRFPALLDRLADGSLNLSTLRLLAPHLRGDNFDSLVDAANGKSKREVELLVARVAPRPEVPPSVRRLPGTPAIGEETFAAAAARGGPSAPIPGYSSDRTDATSAGTGVAEDAGAQPAPVLSAVPRAPVHPSVTPLAPERFAVKFTILGATHEKLVCAQQLLRREIPDGDPGQIFDRALDLLLEDVTRRKLAATSKPRCPVAARSRAGGPGGTRSRHIPAHVKREVWLRDAGRCAFVAANGRRCAERAFLEFHHREPYGIGGEATAANVSLRCRAHNVYEAELAFGPGVCATRGRAIASRELPPFDRREGAPARVIEQPAAVIEVELAPGRVAHG